MPTFSRVAPSIYVSDHNTAIRFYRDVLGFSVECFSESDPRAVVIDGTAVLHLDLDRAKAGSSTTHILVEGLEGLRERLTRAGTRIIQPPTDQPWGLREMIISDPDGNVFELAEPVRKSS